MRWYLVAEMKKKINNSPMCISNINSGSDVRGSTSASASSSLTTTRHRRSIDGSYIAAVSFIVVVDCCLFDTKKVRWSLT